MTTGLDLDDLTTALLAAAVVARARHIATTERAQAAEVAAGRTSRFDDYLERRSADAEHCFREHLREIGEAIKEE